MDNAHGDTFVSSGMLTGYRVLGFDLETTGFNPRSERIVEYALIGSDCDGSHIHLQSLVYPGKRIPEQATRVHGITNSDVRESGEFARHIFDIAKLMDDAVIVGHNVIRFDWTFLEMECVRAGVETPKPRAIIDTFLADTLSVIFVQDLESAWIMLTEQVPMLVRLYFFCGK
jgi:DNA polymerase III epsilon subunit-like protein